MIGKRHPVRLERQVRILNGRRVLAMTTVVTLPQNPGEYCGPITGYTGDKPAVFFLKPHARDPGTPPSGRSVQHVTSPPHVFTECADGSLQIRESLGETRSGLEGDVPDGWHGYLDCGHNWRKV
jgi:hypothetical protein